MKHTFANSSHLDEGQYDPSNGVLRIEFKGGEVYEYDITDDLWEKLKSAKSAGKFMHSHIKHRGGRKSKKVA